MQDEITVGDNDIKSKDWNRVINSIEDVRPQVQEPSSMARIHKVPTMLRETRYYDKYYVPKVVSIGPYHHGKQKLELVEKLKPRFVMELLMKYNTRVESLLEKLINIVQDLRMFYEEEYSTNQFSDEVFIQMMLLDGCFILYYIEFVFEKNPRNCPELRSHEIVLIHQDLFLLENQIPFRVLYELINVMNFDNHSNKIESFVSGNIYARERQKIRGWFDFESSSTEYHHHDHLLHHLYSIVTGTSNDQKQKDDGYRSYFSHKDRINTIYTKERDEGEEMSNRRTFHNVNELMDIGIRFKPSSSMCLDHVEFVRRCWWFSADVKLPPITVNRLLNLLAYEMCSGHAHDDWVTAYLCLLDSLIEHPEDVKALRNAGVLDYPLGNENDKEVVELFNQIGFYLVSSNLAYMKVVKQIQSHYDRWSNARLSDLKHDYMKSPWSLLALLAGVMVLFLSAVQTYFTVWSPKSECDDLCKFIKMNHHL